MQNNRKPQEEERGAFQKSRKMMRSPDQGVTEEGKSAQVVHLEEQPNPSTAILHEDQQTPASTQDVRPAVGSPRQELIYKMRALEEETIEKCRAVLRKMKHAMLKQRNISMDVKDGASELSELLDILGNYRKSWLTAETERVKETNLAAEANKQLQETDTPVSSRKKRTASSPAEPEAFKKPKSKEAKDGFKTVTRKKGKPKTSQTEETNKAVNVNPERKGENSKVRSRSRPEAVLVKPAEGRSYAEVLRELRENLKPDETDTAIRSVRKTKSGDLLLELAKGSKSEKLCESIKHTLKENATVRTIRPLSKLEIRDLDSLTNEEEVITAIKFIIGEQSQEVKVRLTGANNSEQKRAFVILPTEEAAKILKEPRIKIGWTRCRVKRCIEVTRCFRCFGVGHLQRDCSGPDRRDLCIRCGETGHKMRNCTKTPKCCLCAYENRTDLNHFPGTSNCAASTRKTQI
ncbi:uncharacterized protein LOC123037863 [Drosophila rhopaloa]|uniref:CCHC-type domain-containing protein n=1 Tax=Drosophila rhopaloa TaxID=1041015 RepID=A0ABM5JCA6_DRORH|nr:uncharacterized protein LOC123037863 [Drosophila rhopaloa]